MWSNVPYLLRPHSPLRLALVWQTVIPLYWLRSVAIESVVARCPLICSIRSIIHGFQMVSVSHRVTPYIKLPCVNGPLDTTQLLQKIRPQQSRALPPQDSCCINSKARELKMLFAQTYPIHSSTDIPSDFVCILGLAKEIMVCKLFSVWIL